jgi:hypothetical protein
VGQSVICAAELAPAEPIVSVPVSDVCCDLLELFAGVSDGRVGQGRDHPVAAVLALAAAAVVAGMKGYTAACALPRLFIAPHGVAYSIAPMG